MRLACRVKAYPYRVEVWADDPACAHFAPRDCRHSFVELRGDGTVVCHGCGQVTEAPTE